MKYLPMAAGIAALAASLTAQTVSFDVASIRPNKDGGAIATTSILPGGSFEARNATLSALIRRAYGPIWNWPLHPQLVTGGPTWVHNERFDVQARPPEEALKDPNLVSTRVQAMLKSLLADRFKLRLHAETRRLQVYQLQLARRDGRLGACIVRRESESQKNPLEEMPACKAAPGLTSIRIEGEMANVARSIGFFVGSPAVDRTGLAGTYFIALAVRPDQAPNMPPTPGATPSLDGPTWSVAVEEQLGLRLVEVRDEVEVLVVDSAELPSEN